MFYNMDSQADCVAFLNEQSLNPDEGVWSLAKRDLANGCPLDVDELMGDVIRSIKAIRTSPERLRGRHRTRRQLPFGEEVGLVLPDVLPSQAIGRALEMSSESLDLAKVVACGGLRVMTTLEFLQHDFS